MKPVLGNCVGRFPDCWLFVVGRTVLRGTAGVLAAGPTVGATVGVAVLLLLIDAVASPEILPVFLVADGAIAVLMLLVSLGRLACWLSALCWIARNIPAMSATKISSAII